MELPLDHSADPRMFARRMAQIKAQDVKTRMPGAAVLGSDTVVVVNNTMLGKPIDEKDVARMLRMLSGRWHRVITGVCLIGSCDDQELRTVRQPPATGTTSHGHFMGAVQMIDHEETEVELASLSESEIDAYVASGEPFDKAGAYGIQGGASSFVVGLKGSLDNVVGLPVRLVRRMITQMEASVEKI